MYHSFIKLDHGHHVPYTYLFGVLYSNALWNKDSWHRRSVTVLHANLAWLWPGRHRHCDWPVAWLSSLSEIMCECWWRTLWHECSLWSPYVIAQTIIFLPCDFYLLSFFPRLISAAIDWISTILVFYTWRGPSANLECRSQTCCTRLAGNTGRKNDAKNRHLRTTAQLLSGCFFRPTFVFPSCACADFLFS